jgi:hypothetical protein
MRDNQDELAYKFWKDSQNKKSSPMIVTCDGVEREPDEQEIDMVTEQSTTNADMAAYVRNQFLGMDISDIVGTDIPSDPVAEFWASCADWDEMVVWGQVSKGWYVGVRNRGRMCLIPESHWPPECEAFPRDGLVIYRPGFEPEGDE